MKKLPVSFKILYIGIGFVGFSMLLSGHTHTGLLIYVLGALNAFPRVVRW